MSDKPKVAFYWCSSCGGCEEAVVDLAEGILDVVAAVDIVFWPVAMDFKLPDLRALPDGTVDFGLYNGAVRTDEHVETAHLFRTKCKVLVAYGSCACFGGIPGLANLASKEEIFQVAYQDTPSTENPERVRPQTRYACNGHELTLPEFLEQAARELLEEQWKKESTSKLPKPAEPLGSGPRLG